MQCQSCNKQPASLRITRLSPGSVEELHLCDGCASKVSPFHAKMMKKKQIPMTVEHLLKEMLEGQTGAAVEKGEEGSAATGRGEPLTCPKCGLDFSRYRQTWMLGCPACYDAFGEKLEGDLRKMHGAVEHKGAEAPPVVPSLADVQAQVRALRAEMEEAVEEEDFERAAQLRNEVRRLLAQMPAAGGSCAP